MPRVAVFNTQFLPYSQTFVYEELRQHQRYDAEVFARWRMLPERFPYRDVHVAGPLYGVTRRDRGFDRLFEQRRFDVVHAHFGTGAVYAVRWAERFDLPLVVTFHGRDVTRLCTREKYFPDTWRYALLSPGVFQRMTLGLCVSNELRELLTELGVPEQKLCLHRLGIDLSTFARGAREPRVVQVAMIGRFVPKKGFDLGLRAFARAARTRPSARLIIVGDGELDEALRRLAAELDLGDRTVFTGALPAREIADVLGNSEILLAPSVIDANGDREGCPTVLKEASACEVVPLSTRLGGIPDAVEHGVTGFLVEPRDEGALAEHLGRLLDDATLRERMGRAARAKMQREYEARDCVTRLEAFYDEAIASFRSPR